MDFKTSVALQNICTQSLLWVSGETLGIPNETSQKTKPIVLIFSVQIPDATLCRSGKRNSHLATEQSAKEVMLLFKVLSQEVSL